MRTILVHFVEMHHFPAALIACVNAFKQQ